MMNDDKEILIIDPEDLELELNSPYNTTTTNQSDSSPHKKVYIPSSNTQRPKLKLWFKNQPEFSQRISTISFTNKRDVRRDEWKGVGGYGKVLSELWLYHWRMVLGSSLTAISSAACLISFPLHLEGLKERERNAGEGAAAEEGAVTTTDGFSACFAISTILVLLFLLTSLGVKLVYWGSVEDGGNEDDEMRIVTVLKPCISWKHIFKIGFSVGLSVLALCSAWEDNKVLCNLQDPLLGIVVIFASITYAVTKWRHFGLKRAFALLSVAAGVFVSVVYLLVDHHRCRGNYFTFPPKDVWSWKVHFVWTLAFVIAIWLWTVAMFCLESAVPFPTKMCRNGGEEYNAVKMKVLRTPHRTATSNHNQQTVIESSRRQPPTATNADFRSTLRSRRKRHIDPYTKISYVSVFNAVLWFHIASWAFIASLFWTEFVPGFGISKNGDTAPHFLQVIWTNFDKCFHDGCSWWLITALFVYSQSFTYVLLLTKSSMLAICISCFGFPLVGIWWSIFQVNTHNMFIWMPVYTGELVCSVLGLPLILAGTVYLFKLDILNPSTLKVPSGNAQRC